MNTPIKRHGGKHYLAKWIISHFPEHIHYVEPFFGGGSVLLQKPDHLIKDHSEVVNDLETELYHFWHVLQDEQLFNKMKRKLQATPVSEMEFNKAVGSSESEVESAVNFFIRARQSRQGLGKDFNTLSRTRVRRGMNEQVSAWWSAIDGLDAIYRRIQRVVVLNRPAIQVIRQQDSLNTFFYLDPPYFHTSRASKNDYQHEMSAEDHLELLEALTSIKGKFALSGYHNSLYDAYAIAFDWRCSEIQIDNKASGKKKKDIKSECLWMNYGEK